jgi:PPOX class probable FMN-dependent enzyme
MDTAPSHNLVTTVEALEALYDRPAWAAIAKECDTLIAPYQSFVEAAPYLMLATAGAKGVECSSRGGEPGFVRIRDANTLLIPDFSGNNRIESLRNIVRDGAIALHFLIPGCGETLRVKGRAVISVDPDLLLSFEANGKNPRAVIIVSVAQVYFHCSKAVTRSRLWDVSRHIARDRLPSVNVMLAAVQWRRCRDTVTGRVKKSPELLAS